MTDRSRFDPWNAAGALLDAAVSSSHDAFIAVALDGTIEAWSRGAERMFGFEAAEAVGRSMLIVIPNDRSNEFSGLLDRVRDGQHVEDFETVRRARSGDAVNVLLNARPIRSADDRVSGALIVARDLTRQRQAERSLVASEGRWRAVIDSAVDAMIVIDARGAIEVFNPAAERLFGYTEQEVLGRNVNLLMPAPYRDEHDEYISRYLRTGEQRIIGIGREVTGRRRDGTTFPVHLSVGEMRAGTERHFTGILHDLSPRVELEERVREQTALARIGEMAAVIAHEVKNPLAAVRGAIQVIGSRLPAGSREGPVVKEIIGRIDALDELIKDMLLFARTPQPRPAPVHLASLLRLTADLLAADPAFNRLRVEIDGEAPPLAGDAELLKIVFQNLFINAAQAMQGEGLVQVVLGVDNGVQRVRVADAGPGMPADVRANVFRPFFTTKARGTGLGLATAKRLVEAHAGTIAVECPPSGGTVVTVTLPAGELTVSPA